MKYPDLPQEVVDLLKLLALHVPDEEDEEFVLQPTFERLAQAAEDARRLLDARIFPGFWGPDVIFPDGEQV